MVTTAFGYSSFGHAAFGQSSTTASISIECRETVYQAAVWYIVGNTHHKNIIDVGESFGIEGEPPFGEIRQVGNIAQVQLHRECYIVSVSLFDTHEDLSYMYRIPVWDSDSVFPQVRGAARQWMADTGMFLSAEYEGTPVLFVEDTAPLKSSYAELPEKNHSPALGKDQGNKKIDVIVETIKVEEL